MRALSSGAPLAAFLALSSASARWIASAARTARSASFSCARIAEDGHHPIAKHLKHVSAKRSHRP